MTGSKLKASGKIKLPEKWELEDRLRGRFKRIL
jgi:hypothetical protein